MVSSAKFIILKYSFINWCDYLSVKHNACFTYSCLTVESTNVFSLCFDLYPLRDTHIMKRDSQQKGAISSYFHWLSTIKILWHMTLDIQFRSWIGTIKYDGVKPVNEVQAIPSWLLDLQQQYIYKQDENKIKSLYYN